MNNQIKLTKMENRTVLLTNRMSDERYRQLVAWHNAEEHRPADGMTVLAFMGDCVDSMAYDECFAVCTYLDHVEAEEEWEEDIEHGYWDNMGGVQFAGDVTWWMPLPQLPADIAANAAEAMAATENPISKSKSDN